MVSNYKRLPTTTKEGEIKKEGGGNDTNYGHSHTYGKRDERIIPDKHQGMRLLAGPGRTAFFQSGERATPGPLNTCENPVRDKKKKMSATSSMHQRAQGCVHVLNLFFQCSYRL